MPCAENRRKAFPEWLIRPKSRLEKRNRPEPGGGLLGGLRKIPVARLQFEGLSLRHKATRPIEPFAPVIAIELLDTHDTPRRGRMNEAIVAHIDSDMGKSTSHRVEEDQISGLQILNAIDLVS
mgnify:CR=1 FL=1